jgi:hypothetical protein
MDVGFLHIENVHPKWKGGLKFSNKIQVMQGTNQDMGEMKENAKTFSHEMKFCDSK